MTASSRTAPATAWRAVSIQQAIAGAIIDQLAQRGRSETWLAAELGMSPGSLSSRLTGRTALDTEDIDAIAGVLGMSGFELLALAGSAA